MILNAITEVITAQTNQDPEVISATAYFAALMSSLEQQEKHTAESTGAIAFLLSVIFPQVPPGVLHSKFEAIANLFLNILRQQSEEAYVTKSVLSCCSTVVSVLERAMWAQQASCNLLQALLVFAVDERPKVRKEAQAGVVKAVAMATQERGGVPKQLAETIVKFCTREISQCTSKEAAIALYLCGLLSNLLPLLPPASTLAIFQPLLSLVPLGNAILTVQTMRVITSIAKADLGEAGRERSRSLSVFSTKSDDTIRTNRSNTDGTGASKKKKRTDKIAEAAALGRPHTQGVAALLQKLLTSVVPLKPHKDDAQAFVAYVQCTAASLGRMSREDPLSVKQVLPKMVQLLSEGLTSGKPSVCTATTKALRAIMTDCLNDQLLQQSLKADNKAKSCLGQLLASLENLLSFPYQLEWNSSLNILAAFFEALPSSAAFTIQRLLVAMDEMRNNEEFMYLEGVEVAFSAALKSIGPELMLETLPLVPQGTTIQDSLSTGRWWLLPLFKVVKSSKLAYFSENFVPLLKELQELAQNGNDTRAATIVVQVWQTFPCFCNEATDITTAFKPLAKSLGNALMKPEFKVVREQVALGLKVLIETAQDTNESTAQQKLKTIAGFGKNFMPALFNTVNDTDPSKRVMILGTITAFSAICSPALVNQLFKKVLQKLLSEGEKKGSEESHALGDIALSMIPNLNEENCAFLYRTTEPHMSSPDAMLQRKSYKIVRRLCELQQDWFDNNWKSVLGAINNSMVACKATKDRLKCMKELLTRIPDLLSHTEVAETLSTLLGEVMLAVKEVSLKTREVAYDLLIALAKRLLSMEALNQGGQSLITEYLIMLMAGLAGKTPRMKSAAVLVLGRLVYELRSQIAQSTQADVFVTVLLLLREKSREVIKSVLGFCKVCILSMDKETCAPHLEELVQGLTLWENDSKNRFRLKVRGIFEILVKRFGFEQVQSLVPQSHTKLIAHIKKTQERETRKKAEAWASRNKDKGAAATNTSNFESLFDSDDEGSDDEETTSTKQQSQSQSSIAKAKAAKAKAAKSKGKKEEQKMWIRDSDIDLLDTNIRQHIASSNPTSKKKKRKAELEVNSEGKFVIPSGMDEGNDGADSDSDAEEAPRPMKRQRAMSIEDGTLGKKKPEKLARSKGERNGSMFKSKKATGDMLKKGQYEPYAFLPLNPKQLNKRSRSSAANKFENVVSAARKGASKGNKAHKTTLSRKQKAAKRKHMS